MAVDLTPIATELVRWLGTKPGVSAIQGPIISPKRLSQSQRLPLPMPSFLRAAVAAPSFEIRFLYKGQQREFLYFVEQQDDPRTILNTFRVHTNGELLVRIPNEHGQLMPNEIYYVNRSSSSAAFGSSEPLPGQKR